MTSIKAAEKMKRLSLTSAPLAPRISSLATDSESATVSADVNANIGGGGDSSQPWRWKDPVSKTIYSGVKEVANRAELEAARKKLPIFAWKAQFIHAVDSHQVVIVVGETGSGKSTQMPQYLLEGGLVRGGRIACTQPRRVAAMSVAQRVAQELGCYVGETVGYAIRFEDCTGVNTVIKYMTDGLLLMECLRDPLFTAYACVIIDEAHERTLHTDVLLGLLKKAMRVRPELKVIITSATLDIRKFADYFEAPMVKIPGKIFPVSIEYLPHPETPSLASRLKKSEALIEQSVGKVIDVHIESPVGDILLFMPGKEEVDAAVAMLNRHPDARSDFSAIPVYAALPFETQCHMFATLPSGRRKIVVATNIAETSLTIEGIAFVVDSGLFKENVFESGIDALKVAAISRAQSEQRAGRAGRTAPGKCFRLYTHEDYLLMDSVQKPAIDRIDFTATALQLKAMGIDDICGFGFMDPPKRYRVDYALGKLQDLGALDKYRSITDLGYKMSEFPLAPRLSKILLTAAEMGCSAEVLAIVSMLSVKYHIFRRPPAKRREADACVMQFYDFMGDHLTLLNVYLAWVDNGRSELWARDNYIEQKELEKAGDIREQLLGLMNMHGVPVLSVEAIPNYTPSTIRKAIAAGSPDNVAARDPNIVGGYRVRQRNHLYYIHPSSALYKRHPELVIFNDTVTTTRTYMRTVSVCNDTWIRDPAVRGRRLADIGYRGNTMQQHHLW